MVAHDLMKLGGLPYGRVCTGGAWIFAARRVTSGMLRFLRPSLVGAVDRK